MPNSICLRQGRGVVRGGGSVRGGGFDECGHARGQGGREGERESNGKGEEGGGGGEAEGERREKGWGGGGESVGEGNGARAQHSSSSNSTWSYTMPGRVFEFESLRPFPLFSFFVLVKDLALGGKLPSPAPAIFFMTIQPPMASRILLEGLNL